MKKMIIGLMVLSSASAFAVEHCGLINRVDGRIRLSYIDGRDMNLEVYIPSYASKNGLTVWKDKKINGGLCFQGTVVKKGNQSVLIATDVTAN